MMKWTPEKILLLRQCVERGLTQQAAAREIGVTLRSVKAAGHRYRVFFSERGRQQISVNRADRLALMKAAIRADVRRIMADREAAE